jgi:hypothetical protein
MPIDLSDERRRERQTNFGSLSAGMIVRGSVPASVLFGGETPGRPQPPTSLRDVNANVAAKLGRAPQPESTVVAITPELPLPTSGGPRKAVTVRLDPVHHMRLRLVGSYTRRSAQDILVQALNAYLNNLPASVPGGGPSFADEAN